MSVAIIQGLERSRSVPCLPTAAPERHASTGSSRLTISTQPSRPSSWWMSNDSVSMCSSTLQALHQAVIPTVENYSEYDLSWYRNIEYWDYENKMVKIGASLGRQRQKHDSLQSEAAEQTSGAEVKESGRTAQAAQPKDDSAIAILTHLRKQTNCPLEPQGSPAWVTEPMSISLMSAEIRDLQQTISQHLKHGKSIPATKVSRELDVIQSLVLMVNGHGDAVHERKTEPRRELLRAAIYKLIQDLESLIDPHRTCVVCERRERVDTFPAKATSRCTHETNTCSPCLQKWIESQITDKSLKIKCVECPEQFQHSDIQKHAPKEIFERFDKISARAAISSIPDFYWCLNSTCPSGQENISGARFTCYSCHHQYCIKHGTAWHQNETCNQYDTRWTAARIQDQASEEWKAEQAKKCPKCSALIEKDGGCDHMGCTAPGCNHQFNWSTADQYEAQDSVMPPMDLNASLAVPQGVRRFKISKVFRSMFFRDRDVC